MRLGTPRWGTGLVCASALVIGFAPALGAATIDVPAGGDLQAAINLAQGGDVITLAPGATYAGNFILPNKPGVTTPIVIRSAAADSLLPPDGVRMTPAYSSLLPKIKSPNNVSALRTAAGSHHWTLMFLEFLANRDGYGEVIALGAGDSTQSQLSQVPYSLVVDRIYLHGDPAVGQKRGIALNSRDTTIKNSYIAECKAVGQDSQAIGGFNGPGGFVIENNYLEGAAENILLGGADPAIPGLVISNVTFRGNHLYKPLSWRDPIIETPTGAAALAVPAGGSLAPGTYYYKIVARRGSGQATKANSIPSGEVSATLSVAGGVAITWSPVAGAEDYTVWGRTSGGQNVYWKTTVPSFTDVGAAGTSSALPSAKGTKWAVKNIFELKNAQDVLVEGNVMENLWVADQPGYPIVFTPRNQSGGAPWTIVQRVVFRRNLVRHTAGGVNVLGVDDVNPSLLTNDITIAHNVFDDMTSATWGSGARFIQLGGGPDRITVDHNTVISTTSTVVWLYGGPAASPTRIPNFVYTNNMSRHNTYGIFGSNYSTGMASINAYMPDALIRRNVLAGGTASKYPADNFFPSVAAWQADFVNFSSGDFHLVTGSQYRAAGTDGADLGADIETVMTLAAAALSGDSNPGPVVTPVRILTDSLPNAVFGQPYSQALACSGGSTGCAWALRDSTLATGLSFDPAQAVVAGTASAVAPGTITVEAFDPGSTSNSAVKTLSVAVDPPAFTIDVPSAPEGRVGLAYQLAPTVSGAIGAVSWTVSSGVLPGGLGVDPGTGLLSGTASQWGTFTFVLLAQDSWSPGREASRAVAIVVAPEPLAILNAPLGGGMFGQPYSASIATTGGTGAANWSLVAGALPGGVVVTPAGAIAGTPSTPGTFQFTVQAVDANWPAYSATQQFTLSIAAPTLSAVAPPQPEGRVGNAYQWSASASGVVGAASWTIASGALPPGLALDGATGVVAGVPSGWGSYPAVLQVRDSYDASRIATAPIAISVAPTMMSVATVTVPDGSAWSAYRTTLAATGGTGTATWSLSSGTLPSGMSLDAAGVLAGAPTQSGSFTFTAAATDNGWPGNGCSRSLTLTVSAPVVTLPEIVLYAGKASTIVGRWAQTADASAAGGASMSNPNLGAAKVNAPAVNPADYFELTFKADAHVPYHLWIRGKAQGNSWANDSVFVQFSQTIDDAGAPLYRIGTTSGLAVSIEDTSNAGLSGWGWQDQAMGGFGAPLYFATSGPQTVRIQVREDGLAIDQIVLSDARYLASSPGALKNDTTILPETSFADTREIVMYAADAVNVTGTWSKVADASAAAGTRIYNPNLGSTRSTAAASPTSFFDIRFQAEAGVAYHLWVRGKADNNSWANDSVFIQFSGSVTAGGVPVNRIGTTSAASVTIEDAVNAGLAGWGWQDDALGSVAPPMYFAQSGEQTIRVQIREDGLSIDQIVLSSARYLTAAPGAKKNDGTIVSR